MIARTVAILCGALVAVIAAASPALARTGHAGARSTTGFADIHLHVTADLRAGGNVIYGKAFDPDGIAAALGRDAEAHGPMGILDVTGNLLRDGSPAGSHDTDGWPAFSGWPTYDTNTHQQVYFTWLRRVWKAGLSLIVAQTVEDEPLCELEVLRTYPCDEFGSLRRQVERLRGLQDYLDTRAGGRGRGWFRLVYSARQAQRVIRSGKLAVVIGAETSNPFGCSEYEGRPQCDRADIDRGIERFRRLGIRSMFPAHWVDNALAGAGLEGGDKGTFINLFNRLQTGHFFRTEPCPASGEGEEPFSVTPGELAELANAFPALEPILSGPLPSYPPGPQCNSKGLTGLGRYAIGRLMDAGMMIEADHLSIKARREVLRIAARRRYPLVSSHTGTGGAWVPGQLRRLYRVGGLATARPASGPELARRIVELHRRQPAGVAEGVPLGTDTGGFSSLPGPPAPEDGALSYPFRPFGGSAALDRQRTGLRVFDLNTDGVAHYGLFADLLAHAQSQPRGRRAMRVLHASARSYLRMWRRAYRR